MKKILYILSWLLINNSIYSQNNIEYSKQYCVSSLQDLKMYYSTHNSLENSDYISNHVDSIIDHLYNIYFYRDDSLVSFINNMGDLIQLSVVDGMTYINSPERSLLFYLEMYIKSLNFENLHGIERIREILNQGGNNLNLLSQSMNNISVDDFILLFSQRDRVEKATLLYDSLKKFNKTQLDTIFEQIENEIYNSTDLLCTKLNYAELFPMDQRDSIKVLIKSRFEAIMDTTNEGDVLAYDSRFNNSKKWLAKVMKEYEDFDNEEPELDSNEIIHRQEIDECIANLDWNRIDKNHKTHLEYMIQTGEVYEIHFFDPTDPRHSAAELLDYYQHADTTLNSNSGKHNGYFGDDGRRFDTLNNQELIDLLSTYNYQLIADTLVTEADLNSTAQIIHLRKITQLIGDRIIIGTFVLDTSQTKEINRLLSFCEQVLAMDTSRAWTEECFSLVFRVWWPFQPMLRSWLTSSNEKLASYSKYYLHKLINETMARELVQLSGEAFDQGNRPLAERYMAPLQSIDSQWALKDNDRMPPRRFVNRTFDESIRWWEEFILPGMVRIGWRVKK